MKGGRGVAFLYEDADILVVDKPSGLPVIAPDGSRAMSLYDIVTDRIRQKNPKGRAAVVHRLDRDSSGVMVFARHAIAKKALMQHWNDAVLLRRYTALAEGTAEADSGVFDSWLKEMPSGSVHEVRPGEPGALRAVTRWRLVGEGKGYSLLELDLETGRKHQIRAQLAAAGAPIAGDARYGASTDPLGRLCLHATIIELRHPRSGEIMRFESPPPESFAKALRRG
ncbi:MAG: RluA family pseudouridine synthase [Rectinemataceae bacterium]